MTIAYMTGGGSSGIVTIVDASNETILYTPHQAFLLDRTRLG